MGRLNKFLVFVGISALLTGCLQKAKTQVASLAGFTIVAPTMDSASPPDFEGADDKGYVRFKGTCPSVVSEFEIQIVHESGVLDWVPVPTTALADPRSTAVQAAYPLVAAEYDTNCNADGTYDFWIYVSQVASWLNTTVDTIPEVYSINIRGRFGGLPTSVLNLPASKEGPPPEANDFSVWAGYMPIGTGLCQKLEFALSQVSGTQSNYRVKNSSSKTFTVTLDTGLILGTNIQIYDSVDCTGTPIASASGLSFTMASPNTNKTFSFKALSTISTSQNITATSSDFGSTIIRQTSLRSLTASNAEHVRSLHQPPEFHMKSGECFRIDLIAVDANGASTNNFQYGNATVTAILSDSAKYEFRSECGSGSTVLSSTGVQVTFTNNVDTMKSLFVRAKIGTLDTDSAQITFSQSGSEFQTLPTLFINPSKPIHHLSLDRVDQLSYLFNHECYPAKITLRSSSNLSLPTVYATHVLLNVSDQVQLSESPDCSTYHDPSTAFIIPANTEALVFYWSRRQLSPLTTALGDSTGAQIVFAANQYWPHISNPETNVALSGLAILKSPLDILGRGRQEIRHWYFGQMNPGSSYDISNYLQNPNFVTSGSKLESGSGIFAAPVRMDYAESKTDVAGTSRLIRREIMDFNYNNGVDVPFAVMSNSSTFSLTTSGSAMVVGGYFYVTDRTPSAQTLLADISDGSPYRYSLQLFSNGNLKLLYSYNSSVSCAITGDAIQAHRWYSIFVRFENRSGSPYCRLYVDGAAVSEQVLTTSNLTTTSFAVEPQIGGLSSGSRFRGYLLEAIVDVDESASATSVRFADSVFYNLHNQYFDKRYLLSP